MLESLLEACQARDKPFPIQAGHCILAVQGNGTAEECESILEITEPIVGQTNVETGLGGIGIDV